PDGTKFNIPSKLTFHYTDENVNGTNPYLLYIAFQDDSMMWKADFKKRDVDTAAKTVSLDISHFSIWSVGDNLRITANPDAVQADRTSAIEVFESIPTHSSAADFEEGLVNLPRR